MTSAGSVLTSTVSDQDTGGGLIPTSALHLRPIPWHVARGFIIEHHYLHRVAPMQRLCLGVFAHKELGANLIGVMLWGTPIAANRLARGDTTLELTRMYIMDVTTKNAESRCLAIATRIIRATFTDTTDLIACSDIEGRGHTGTIYSAAGWINDSHTEAMSWAKHPRPGKDRGSNTRKLRWRKVL